MTQNARHFVLSRLGEKSGSAPDRKKMGSWRSCLRATQVKCPETSWELLSNPSVQDIILLNVARAVQLCAHIAAYIGAKAEQRVPNKRFGMSSAGPAGYR